MLPTDIAGLLAVTDDTFGAEVLEQGQPVLVDFWAQWCPHCRMLTPVLAEIARERADSLTVRTLNADENPQIVRAYQVLSLPTLILFREGAPIHTIVGARSKARLLSALDTALNG